jgi:hypothetical protein
MLVDELLRFRVKINTATGNDSYGAWREGAHVDICLPLACACWVAERYRPMRLDPALWQKAYAHP